MRKITKRKVESIRRKFECNDGESPRDKICRLIDAGSVDIEDALLSCVQAMSEDDCERVLQDLALAALEGNCTDCEDEVSVEVDDLDDTMPGDDEIEDSDVNDEDDEDVEDDEADESCSKRRQLERRIRRMEKLITNEKGLFDIFRKKKSIEPEPELDAKTFKKLASDFLSRLADNLKYDFELYNKGKAEFNSKNTYATLKFMNGASIMINNLGPDNIKWDMLCSDKSIEKQMPHGKMKVDDDELKFADSKDLGKIKKGLAVQSDFTVSKNDRQAKEREKDRAAADAAWAKKNRKEDPWSSKRMNPYSSDWI